MRLKINKKHYLIILGAAVFILSIFLIPSGLKFVRRLLNWPQSFSNIQNTNSKLLPLLLQKGDFSKDWQWDLIITYQNDKDPLNGENRIIEFSTRQFVGLYKNHSVRVMHSIYRYKDDFSLSNIKLDPALESVGLNNVTEKFTFSMPEEFDREPNCYLGMDYHQNTISRCVLVKKKNNILERVDIDVYKDMTKELIKQATIDIQSYLESRTPPK